MTGRVWSKGQEWAVETCHTSRKDELDIKEKSPLYFPNKKMMF
jgi:hypothetical protein